MELNLELYNRNQNVHQFAKTNKRNKRAKYPTETRTATENFFFKQRRLMTYA